MRFDWVERVRAYDAWREMMIREAMEERLREDANKEVEEQLELKRMRRAYAKKAARKADDMLSFPTERRVLDHDGQTVHVHPARWSFATPSYLDTIVAGAAEPSDQQEGTSPEFERLLDILQRSKSAGE